MSEQSDPKGTTNDLVKPEGDVTPTSEAHPPESEGGSQRLAI